MRLSKIKIAGFKSFVDATEVLLPSNRIGVVGPNGCGKSNIIDAVRWVMGETSAKMLRGEAMTDVIFTGSASRKPVGMATVELIFDNSDGQIKGEYATYNEISVKRQVNRDSQSFYYLNNSKCRKKDIVDLFLGTGLGPRSYSIIEQGMISKIVDSKPEDLRGYIEEAAGVSKYRDRRRDTERRIARTRENLERLDDLRSEVGKHIQHLQRQAKNAERYSKLKEQYRQSQAEILTLRWQHWDKQALESEQLVANRQTALEEVRSHSTGNENQVETLRLAHQELVDQGNLIQEQLYQINSEVGKVEQAITYAKTLSERQQQELQQTDHNLNQFEQQLVNDEEKLVLAQQHSEQLKPKIELAEAQLEETKQITEEAEIEQNTCRQELDALNEKLAEENRTADAHSIKIKSLDENLLRQSNRLQQLSGTQQTDQSEELKEALQAHLTEREQQQSKHEELELQFNSAKDEKETIQNKLNTLRAELSTLQQQMHQDRGRHTSLLALQQAEQSADDSKTNEWLKNQSIMRTQRLSDLIDVDPGWEQVVELVMGSRLQSLVSNSDDLLSALGSWDFGKITAISENAEAVKPKADTLSAHVRGPSVIYEWFNSIRVCENEAQASKLKPSLKDGEFIAIKAGYLMGKNWLETDQGENRDGFLIRQKELNLLEKSLQKTESDIASVQMQLEELQQQRNTLDRQIEQRQLDVNMSHRRLSELDSFVRAKESEIEQSQKQQAQLSDEAQLLKEQIESDQAESKAARKIMEQALNRIGAAQQQKEVLAERLQTLQENYQQARSQLNELSNGFFQDKMLLQSQNTLIESAEQAKKRLQDNIQALRQRKQDLLQQINQENDPSQQHQKQLEQLIQQRVGIEQSRDESVKKVNESKLELNNLETKRQSLQQRIDEARSELENAKLDWQSKQMKATGFKEQLQDKGFDVEELIEQLDQHQDIEIREAAIEKLQRSIVRLEPVNLAAIDEYEEESKRKEYLDAQNEDLEQALEKLERAIQKIDKDTRTLFKETFEQVNSNIKQIFPRLFGGGHAYLELTGNDLLTTGVAILARPPGKRVSSIQLLSGGEKALTAVSLVFAIFNLNPAPFCMLDEVDAPLDDANVKRFSDMVAEMSEKVQFLFVTHNKITMEIANQLMGVTMREAGVSRLVSVDLAEAAKLVE